MTKKFSHIPALDGLRGIAVLLVMIFHADLISGGFIGVDIFFCLSGFLITSLLIQEYESTGTINFKRFYARRILRLAPALILMLVVYRLAMPHLIDRGAGSWNVDVLITFFYSTNWFRALEHWRAPAFLGHTWSLSIEEQFYFIYPLLVFIMLRKWPHKLVTFLVLFAFISAALKILMALAGVSPNRIYNGFDTRMDSLFLGGLAAVLLSRQSLGGFVTESTKEITAFALGFIIAIAFAANWRSGFMLSVGYSAVALLAAAIIISIARKTDSRLNRLLSNRPLVWLGSISYGLYLWHYPIFRVLDHHDYQPVFVLLIGGGMTLASATASYYFVERPVLKLKSRFDSATAIQDIKPETKALT